MSDINHRHPSEDALQAFLDGGVPSRERRRIEEHLASCARCAEELATWRNLFEDLDALPLHRPNADFDARVMAGVRVPEELPWAARLKVGLSGMLPFGRPEHLEADVLQDFAEGVLTARQAARARTHLEGCAACAAEARSWSTVMARLSELERLAPAEGFAERVMTRLRVRPAREATAASRPTSRPWTRALAVARRLVPRTRRAWAAIAGAAVTPAVTFGLVLWAVFSHPTLTPQALVSFAFWQLSDLAIASWTAFVSGGVEVARIVGLDGLVSAMMDAPLVTALAVASYAVAFTAAVRVLYKNLIGSRSPRHRYVSASAS